MKKFLVFSFLWLIGSSLVAAKTRAAETSTLVPASDARFRYEGRCDFSDPAKPVIIWQATRIYLDFEGERLACLFDDVHGQNFFDAQVDDQSCVIAVKEKGSARIDVPLTLSPGRHHLRLFKRTEASAGTARFCGIELAAGAQAHESAPPSYRLTMEFFGDSITVGACNEDGAADQWENRRTHNNALSYGAMTAAAFGADYRNIAVSGMGVVTGWTDVKAGQIWDRVYPRATSPAADLHAWTPDVLFVNLGENDNSFSHAQGKPFPVNFSARYVALVKAMRAAYPKTHIVLLRGGMAGGATSRPLRQAWEAAVTQLEAGDTAIHHFAFHHWSSNHPRVADDRAMADELIAWLEQQAFVPKA
jgi:lysophospholipase L1-like esterase